ncbi:MAG: pentapeptide repeat-containing protein [Myxococcota bacterium]|nr:pentapeptide repeat-containing protein [Myxococcota bacterium]
MSNRLWNKLIYVHLGFALSIAGLACSNTDSSSSTNRSSLGAECSTSSQCERGLCLQLKTETKSRCVETCIDTSYACSNGGICTSIALAETSIIPVDSSKAPNGDTYTNICPPLPSCTVQSDCGANATCIATGENSGNVCKCLDSFFGYPNKSCSVCAAPNSREGCTLNPDSFAEVLGQCRTLDGKTISGTCRGIADCPNTTEYGCFGYQQAISADDPCQCTDIRGLDLTLANSLTDIKGAWYDSATKWPAGFDPTLSGALGPGAQLSSIDLSGEAPTTVSRPITTSQVLTPDVPLDGKNRAITFSGENAVKATPIVSGTFVISIAGIQLSDYLVPNKLSTDPPTANTGTVNYKTGNVNLTLESAPSSDSIIVANFDVRKNDPVLGTVSLPQASVGDVLLESFQSRPVIPGLVSVELSPEFLTPDEALDGTKTSISFSGVNGLSQKPIYPGSLTLSIGDLKLTDVMTSSTSTIGSLMANGIQQGSVSYQDGSISLNLVTAPPPSTAITAKYQYQVTETLSPDIAADGVTTVFLFSRENALSRRKFLAETLKVETAKVIFTSNAIGEFSADDGSSGKIDKETREIELNFKTAPTSDTNFIATYVSDSSSIFTDKKALGIVEDAAGQSGVIDYEKGTVNLRLRNAVADKITASAEYTVSLPKKLAVTPVFDGQVTTVTSKIDVFPLSPGSLAIELSPEAVKLEPAADGQAMMFTAAGDKGLSRLPIAPGTLTIEADSEILRDQAGNNTLVGVSGSAGTVDYETGELELIFSTPLKENASVIAKYDVEVRDLILEPQVPFAGQTGTLSFSSTTAATKTPILPGSTRVRVTKGILPQNIFDGLQRQHTFDLGPTKIAPATLKLRVGSVRLSDANGTGSLSATDSSTGTVDYETGVVSVYFATAPISGEKVNSDYFQRFSNESIVSKTPFDGIRQRHEFQLANRNVQPGTVTASIAGSSFQDNGRGQLSSSRGESGSVNYTTGALVVDFAVAPDSLQTAFASYDADSAVVLKDNSADGSLVSPEGSTGLLNLSNAELQLSLRNPPTPGTEVKLSYNISSRIEFTDDRTPGILSANDGSSGTVSYTSGDVSLNFVRPPAATAATTVRARTEQTVTSFSDLQTIVLDSAVLTNANLSYSDLSNSSLVSADLSGANLTGAILTGAKLNGANLSEANLSGADLTGANFTNTNLAGANLEGTQGLESDSGGTPSWLIEGAVDCSMSTDPNCVSGAYSPAAVVAAIMAGRLDPKSGVLEGVSLKNADLTMLGDLSGAKLKGANLEGANLTGLKLAGADLTDSNLRGAKLDSVQAPDLVCQTDLTPCYDDGASCPGGLSACAASETAKLLLVRADLTAATLTSANIQGSDLTDSTLVSVDLENANLSRSTLVGSAGGDIAPGTILNPKAKKNLDLSFSNLRGTNIQAATLTSATLVGIRTSQTTNFQQAVLTSVNLKSTNLTGGNFTEANLTNAVLTNFSADSSTDFTKANLTTSNLELADIRGGVFDGANFTGANMRGLIVDEFTTMTGATMMGVDLSEACLSNSQILNGQVLMGASLEKTNLVGAQMNGANFAGASLKEAIFGGGLTETTHCRCRPEGGPSYCGNVRATGANFTGADLRKSKLSNTDFRKVIFDSANLSSATLDGTDIRQASLKQANLSNSNLQTTILSGADLSEANLMDANLGGNFISDGLFISTNFVRTNLNGTVFERGNFTGAVLDSVRSNRDTKMRSANLSVAAVVGCLQADLTDANLQNASLSRGALPPNDYSTDYNCRINFEGASFSPSGNSSCGTTFPFALINGGLASSGVFQTATLIQNSEAHKGNLDCAYLPAADLSGKNLSSARLRGANLTGAKLNRSASGTETNLSNAQLNRAVLSTADLEWANLFGAVLNRSDLSDAKLEKSDLRGADLRESTITSGTKFELAKYSCAGSSSSGCTKFPSYSSFRWRQLKMLGPQSDLSGIDLSGYPGLTSPPVDLRRANLKSAKYVWTDVSNVNFSNANLGSVNFSNAITRGSNFSRANLKSAVFSGATIASSTNFSGSNLIEANFVGANGTPRVGGSYCSDKTSFDSASPAYVLLLKISIEGSFPLYFPVITVDLIPGWNVAGQCCFPVQGGIRIGC